jgi:uncharacterized membrane protein
LEKEHSMMSMTVGPATTNARESNGLNFAVWIAQVLSFMAFGMAGVMKPTMLVDQLSRSMAWVPRFSAAVVRFNGVAELCGARCARSRHGDDP